MGRSTRLVITAAAAIAALGVTTAVGAVLLSEGRGTERVPSPEATSAPTGVTRYALAERPDAPPLAGPRLDGGRMDLDAPDGQGQVSVINVWGSWCPPCREEAPDLQRVWEGVESDGVRFMGVNTRDTEAGAEAFVEEFGVTYPSIVDPDGDALLAWREIIPVQAIPSTVVVDREGRVAARVIGPVDAATLRGLVNDIVNEGKPAQ
ncbi:TlpA family protein disulfide reductase [Nocardiopsis gilva YIM 90087]|uniref:TlpA family protein disulfide reductase n=1 Tax=Nocardiopsis gilva YIM 90087 TaxID=1235441 RepID=A0A223S266_9ACTN|nr:TlpA disulfide reductase family protein [Nocardiopsis gilva]ASU82215.1 TlpA family protein disulfide reductase [Nocardiopsis gilva YIM 90087]